MQKREWEEKKEKGKGKQYSYSYVYNYSYTYAYTNTYTCIYMNSIFFLSVWKRGKAGNEADAKLAEKGRGGEKCQQVRNGRPRIFLQHIYTR